jgi:formate dehydrogenase major subunit
VHQIGLPYHWGGVGRVRGDSTNDLIGFVADPNVGIQESKAFTGNIIPGRRSRTRGLAGLRHQPAPAEVSRDLPQVGDGPPQPQQVDPEKE